MIGCIVQARMKSTRLPGKTLLKIDTKNTVLDFVINQLSCSKQIEKIVIATTNLESDDIIENFVKKLNLQIFRGNSNNVLDRYFQCAKYFSFDIIVRITADNPLIDPNIVDDVITEFLTNSLDYITNTTPRTYPHGTEVEVFSFAALEKAWKNAEKPSEKEHVTPYFHNYKNKFKTSNVKYGENISNLRWTIDQKNDLILVRSIISKINKRPILLTDILELLSNEPKLLEINKNQPKDEGYLKSLKEDEEYLKSKKEIKKS